MSEKKFGLVIPKKANTFKMRASSIFNDESDEDGPEHKRPKIPQKKIDLNNKIKQESLDPSVYEYDNIYDQMKAKKAESSASKEKKNSRYIGTLMKAAEKRKMEYQSRVDKKIHAEREKEGDMYKDKDAFVTPSYKKRLQEMEEEEEKERRKNMLNDMMDITKQKDLSGFYRHFLKQTVGEEQIPVFGEKHIKEQVTINNDNTSKLIENIKDNKTFDHTNIDQDSDGIDIDSDNENQTVNETSNKKLAENENTVRRYSDSEEESKTTKQPLFNTKLENSQYRKQLKAHNRKTNISHSESESSENENVISAKKDFCSNKNEKSVNLEIKEANIHYAKHDSATSDDNEVNKKSDECKEPDKFVSKECGKANYAKRLVGDAFISAQARYFQRMSSRKEKIY